MTSLQAGQEVQSTITVLVPSQEKVIARRHLQAWHYLIPILAAFWIAFGTILVLSGLLFLAFSALAVIAAFSILIIALAWAFQNNI